MPRLWLALFFGYNGSGYNGIQHQKQTHVHTIQNQLIPLLHENGYLPTDNYTQLQRKQKYSRIARTDKGVHAVLNGFSCCFVIDKKYFDNQNMLIKNKLHLDLKEVFEQTNNIVFHCFKRVTTRFEMRQTIQSRKYSYVCPVRYFLNRKIQNEEEYKIRLQQTLQKINLCCKQFIGTHNFHNYTRGLKYTDAQSKRYIIQFSCHIHPIYPQFLKFSLIGQSFVYNQIRRMIGSIIFVFINQYCYQFISNTFFKNQFHLPTVPADGLYLKGVDFTGYNKRKEIPQILLFGYEEGQNIKNIQGQQEKENFDSAEVKKSIQKLEREIQEFIINTNTQVWDRWLEETKQGKVGGNNQDEEKYDGQE